jgi:hypothetical protein
VPCPPPGDSGTCTPHADERRFDSGGEYAPEIVPRWSSTATGLTYLTYGLSLWNPYKVDLFRESRPTNTNMNPPTCSVAGLDVSWDLTEFLGESVTVEVLDNRQDGYGFLLTSPILQGNGSSCQ